MHCLQGLLFCLTKSSQLEFPTNINSNNQLWKTMKDQTRHLALLVSDVWLHFCLTKSFQFPTHNQLMNYRRKSSLEVLNHVSKCYIEREFNSWILQAQCYMKWVITCGATKRPSHLVCSAMSLQGYNVKMNFWREFKSWILQAKCYMKWVITCGATKRPSHLVCSAMSLQGYKL